MFTVSDEQDYKNLSGNIGRLQHAYKELTPDASQARSLAADDVGKTIGCSGSELESALAKFRCVHYGGGRKPGASAQNRKFPTKSLTNLYREWCLSSSFVPSDKSICHFTGYSHAALTAARDELKDEFSFERADNNCWKVTQKVKYIAPVKEFTRAQLDAAVNAAVDAAIRMAGKTQEKKS